MSTSISNGTVIAGEFIPDCRYQHFSRKTASCDPSAELSIPNIFPIGICKLIFKIECKYPACADVTL